MGEPNARFPLLLAVPFVWRNDMIIAIILMQCATSTTWVGLSSLTLTAVAGPWKLGYFPCYINDKNYHTLNLKSLLYFVYHCCLQCAWFAVSISLARRTDWLLCRWYRVFSFHQKQLHCDGRQNNIRLKVTPTQDTKKNPGDKGVISLPLVTELFYIGPIIKQTFDKTTYNHGKCSRTPYSLSKWWGVLRPTPFHHKLSTDAIITYI